MKTLIAFIVTLLSLNLFSAELDGVKFDDKVKVGNTELVLNGIGIRKATILKVKVYYGALYVDAKTKDQDVILKSNSPKQITMHFVRDVDAPKIREGFNEGMQAANPNHATFKPMTDKLNSFIPDAAKNERIILTFFPDGITVSSKGKNSEKIGNGEFSKAFLSMWFINPRDEQLKQGLLGK